MPMWRVPPTLAEPGKPGNPGKPGTRRRQDVLVKERTKRPKKYKVLLHNDDFTPMEFVIEVLEGLFYKSKAEATRIMLHVHRHGLGIAGIYSHEVAESKALRTIQLAREAGYPLMASTEPEDEGPAESG